jgi:multicomponent Na+:H+ antiporter subunit C
VTLLFAIVVGVVFGAGVYLLRASDLLRVIVGLVLVSNAASLALMAAGLRRGQPPIQPLEPGEPVSDALVQAMTLTALVIGLAIISLLLALALRIHDTRGTVDLAELRRAEEDEDHDDPEAQAQAEAGA